MTVQKKILDLTGSQYLVQKVKSAINDVDSSLSAHIADTDIHVTTSDKTTWNTVTSKANDSDVVHKSGDETVGGIKTFDSNTYIYNSDNTATTPNLFLKNSKVSKGSLSETGSQLLRFADKNNSNLCELESILTSNGACELRLNSNTFDSNNQNVKTGVTLISNTNGAKRFCPTSNNDVFLGASTLKWSRVYSTEYYYGSNNVEFSTKFVTTDTAQTISGNKTFSSINGVEPSSLSLPSGNLNDVIDISSYLTYLDGTNNTYVAPANGWISITLSNCSGIQAYINGLWGNQLVRPSAGAVRFLMPITKGLTVNILVFGGTLENARFIPCQGNV